MSFFISRIIVPSMLIGWLLATGCSGGESGTGLGGSSSPKLFIGSITGFGSVYVNGIKFDTSAANIRVNETGATEQDLSLGMVVAVVGSTDADQSFGKAEEIYFESDINGIVISNDMNSTLNVMGQTVSYDEDTVFESAIDTVSSIAAVAPDSMVEVSGYRTGDNKIYATQLNLIDTAYTPGEILTVHGIVNAVSGANRFSLGDLTVVIDNATKITNIPNQQLAPGLNIKITSNRGMLNGELQADKIQLDRKTYINTTQSMDVEGIVMQPDAGAGEFLLHGYSVYFSRDTAFSGGSAGDLADGIKAEVQGILLSDTQLEAKQIRFATEKNRFNLIARIEAVDVANNRINILGNVVQLNNRTLFKDADKRTKIKKFSLADVNENDRVSLKAYTDGTTLVAHQFRRIEAVSSDTSFELKGILQALAADEVIISGVSLNTAQITSPTLSNTDIGTTVTVLGTQVGAGQ